MSKFLKNTFLFSLIVLIIHLLFSFCANSYIDDYYGKLSNGHKNSLVIGTSRALQGIVPSIVDSTIGIQEPKLYNFAFTLSSSPFGKVYYDAIAKKISSEQAGKYSIISIDPWSISENQFLYSIEKLDHSSVLFQLDNVTSHPNFEYLYDKYPDGWGNIIMKRAETSLLIKNAKKLNKNFAGSFSFINQDGYLKVYASLDENVVAKKTSEKLKLYQELADSSKVSEHRMSFLLKIISLLKKQGDVYLVRLPVHEEMLQIEQNYMPDFDIIMTEAISLSNGFYDMTNLDHNFKFTDGNHLEKSSSKIVSMKIGKWIKALNKQAAFN